MTVTPVADPTVGNLATPVNSSYFTKAFINALPAYRPSLSPNRRGLEVGMAHGFFLFGPFALTGPLRLTEYANTAGLLAAPAIHAQGTGVWPQPGRTVRVIVPWPPGAANDALGRLLAQKITEKLGGTAVVENRTGGSGLVGTTAVLQAAPAGYTALLTTGPSFTAGLTNRTRALEVWMAAADARTLVLLRETSKLTTLTAALDPANPPAWRAAIDATQEARVKRTLVDADFVITNAVDVLEGAKTDREWSAANGSLTLLARHLGMLTDKVKVDFRDVTQLSDDELEAEARALGIEK
jgi:hypothetical protein